MTAACEPDAHGSFPRDDARERLLTAEQLAARWQVSKAQVYRLARGGDVPTVWIGRYCRFRVAVIEAWEQSGSDD